MGRRQPPSKTTRSAATSSNVVPEVASEAVAQNTTDTQEARQRTMRSNAGVGGRADQLRMIGQTLEAPLKTPRPVTTVPKDVPVNPMAPAQAKKRTKKQGAKNAGSLFPEDPLPRHDSDGSATGLPICTLVTGPPNSRFGFKLNSPPRPGYVGSQVIEAFQKRLEKSLPTATPTAAYRHQRVARTVASTPTVSNKHSRRQVHPTIDEPHSPLSELSEVPEEQLEDKRYPSNNGNLDQDLYDHPVNDDDLYDGPVDGAFSAFDDPQADNDAMDAGSTDNQFNPDNNEDGSRLGSDDATPANSEHEQSPARREIDQASSHQSHIIRQSFKFQRSAIQPLHGSNIQNHSSSHTVRQAASQSLGTQGGPAAPSNQSSQATTRTSHSHHPTTDQPQAQTLPSPPISRENSAGLVNDDKEVSHRVGDEQAGVAYDVLQCHYMTNRRHRSPSSTYLDNVGDEGVHRASKKRRNHKDRQERKVEQVHRSEHEDNRGRDECEGQSKQQVASKKTKAAANDTKLSYYPRQWRSLLDLAKARMRLHLAAEDAFPKLEMAVGGQCLKILHEVMAHYSLQKWELEPDIYPEHREGMCRLLFNDTQTFHSDLKKEVAKNLRVNYNIQPPPNAVKENEQQTEIKKQANKLLSTAAYLRGDGKASNFAHLGLQRPCLSFFYSNSKKALRQFPEFQPHVPYKALALVAAIVYGLLDALRKYGDDKLAFENTSWSTIQDAQQEFLQWLNELCAHEYHGPKLNAMLEDWAKLGMTGYKTNVSVTTCARNEFAMVLD